MSKKIVAMLMAVAMAFSLLPVTALAADGPSATTTKDVVDGYYNDEGKWESGKLENAIPGSLKDTVTTVDKTAKKVDGQDNQYEVTLKVEMKQKKTDVPPGAAATVLVIDTSGSMKYCTKEEHQHTDDCYQWAECTPQVNPNHYRDWDGGHKILDTNCKYKDGRYIYPALQTCGKEEHEHNSDNCKAPYRINVAKEAAENFLKSYRGGTVSNGNWLPSTTPLKRCVSIVSFNTGASKSGWVDVSTADGYNKAIASINALSADGGTNLDAGLRMANAQLGDSKVTSMPANVVVLTDGKPSFYLGDDQFIRGDYYKGSKARYVKVGENTYRVHGNGSQCNDATYTTTASTATMLKRAASVYTVCFGASNERLEAEDEPTVSEFLRTNIATQQAEGKKYAYDANNATELYNAFAAISSSVVSGLNTGKVTDTLPNGVSCTDGTFGEGRTLTWELKADDATQSPADSNGFITYTYEKTYKVEIDPAAEGLNVVNGYVPLNRPTTLTVQHNGSPVQIPFPIPAGKVTYSLTDFKKELVTQDNKPSFDTDGFTIPANTTDPVVVSGEGVTLLYKITVKGNAGAKFTVTDDGATLVPPTDDSIVFNQTGSTFSGTVGNTGETVFYVSKHFNIDADTQTVSNTATIDPGDNTNGLTDNKKTVDTKVTEPDPENYTVTYKWKEGTEVPEGAALPNAGSPIPVNVGETHNVADNPTSDVTKNKAGDSGKWTCTWDKSGAVGSTATAGDNIVITGTWKFTKDPPKTGNLIVKKVVSGEGVTLDDLPNITITVAGTGTNSTYSRELTLATQDTAEPASTTVATWTIRDLTPGTYTVSESSADVKDYTYTVTYNNGTANSDTVTVEKNKTSTMTVTNTYTKNATVKLSDLIKKELTVKKDSKLPAGTTFTVKVTPTTTGDQGTQNAIIGTTTSEWTTGTQNEAGDTTYTVPFNFTNGLSLSAGTHTYTVQETKGDVSGMQYDSNTYTLMITVPGKGEAPYQAEAITIKNTYQTPDLTVTKQPYKVNTTSFDANTTVAHVGDTIVWKVNVTNNKTTQASTQLKDTLGGVTVYSDEKLQNSVNLGTDGTWTAKVPANTTVTYYVTYTVKPGDIPNGKIVNTIVKDGDNNIPSDAPVSTWDTKQLKSATSNLNTSDWTTTVTLTLPTVSKTEANSTETEGPPDPITAISKGSYVIDKIGDEFTFVPELKLTLKVGDTDTTYTGMKSGNTDTYNFGTANGEGAYPYTVTYTPATAQFKWEINQDIPAGTKVTLSYKLKLTNPKTGTYGVKDLDGDGIVDDTNAAFTENDKKNALYTNKSAALYKDKQEIAVFPKPSVSYTVSSGNSGSHSGGSRPSLNTKDHYGYIIGYPVDYYTGQPTTDQTKKPVRPEGKITRAEVATIYFRMLTDESRTKFWSQSNAYSDVKAGDWFNNAVSTLSNAGIIAGYEDGSFRPNGYITRAEFATIAARFFDVTYNGKDLFPDISGHWAKDYINQAANKGFVNGYEDGTFKPDRNITRAEAVTLVNRTLDRHPDKSHFTKDMLVWPDNMDQTKWYYADMQEATNSHTYQMKENSDKTKYENWTKTLPIRNWEALEKAWSNANSSQGNGNVV